MLGVGARSLARRAAGAASRTARAAPSDEAATSSLSRVSAAPSFAASRGRAFAPSRARAFASGPGDAPAGARNPIGWKSLALTFATGGGLLYAFEAQRARRLDALQQTVGPSAGRAALGGHFSLRCANADGAPFNTADLKGKYALLYFGFTMCPDICPDELEKMAEAVNLVRKSAAAEPVVPVFVSIDPERDTVPRVKAYVKEFHPDLIGLTGSVEACKEAAKKYKVYYHKTSDDADDYLVDHSIIMYLVDKRGDFVTFYGKNYTAEEMANAILEQMKRLG